MNYVLVAIVGLCIGVLSGILGVGGGSMMVPAYRLGFGLSALGATGTSLFTMIFTSAAGSVAHVRNKLCIVPLALIAGACGALTAPIGVRLANASPTWLVMMMTALVVAYSAITMIRKGLAVPKGPSVPKAASAAEGLQDAAGQKTAVPAQEVEFEPVRQLTRKQYFIGAVAGVVAGVAGGYVGLGGGFLMVPIFLSGVGISMKQASPTSLLAVAILAASGAVQQGLLGNIDYMVGLVTAAGSIPGAFFGANLVKRIPERQLRLGFGCLLLVVSVLLAINEFLA